MAGRACQPDARRREEPCGGSALWRSIESPDGRIAVCAGLVARPVVPYYTKLSNALQDAIQQALLGKKTPQQALDDVAAQLPSFQK
jgi:hypothetical protein